MFGFFLTSCSLRKRLSHNSASSRAFLKLSVSPWLTMPVCSSCSRSIQLTWLRLAHLEITRHWETTCNFFPDKQLMTLFCNLSIAPKLFHLHSQYITCTSVAFHSCQPHLQGEHVWQFYNICVNLGVISTRFACIVIDKNVYIIRILNTHPVRVKHATLVCLVICLRWGQTHVCM